MQPIFNRLAEQHGMTRRFGTHWTRHFLRCAGFKYRAASGGHKKTKDPKLVDMHMDKLRLRLMHHVTEHKVHPACIMNMDETAAKLLGPGRRGWARPKEDGRVRFIGAEDKGNLTISTVVTMTGTIMAQLIVVGATKRVVEDVPEHEEDFPQLQRQPLVHREHVPGAGRMAWRLGAKTKDFCTGCCCGIAPLSIQRLRCWSGSVLLTLECHVLCIPGGYTAELQPADISVQQPLKHSIKEQAMQFFVESVCRDDAVLDLRLGTMKGLMAHWVIHACK